jgi:type VI secretion system secreted protein VgrG
MYPGRFTTLGRDHQASAPDSASGKDRARVWMESLAARHDVRRGAGTVRHLGTGYRFFVHAEEVGADELERDEFLVVDAVHYLQEAAGYEEVPIRRDLVSERVRLPEDNRDVYSSTFTAIKAATPFRSPPVTPWPRIVGPQTATVVGQGDIHSDALGRIRVRFHWSRKPNGDPLPAQPDIDDHASCRVRVVTPWAGQDYGFVALPRVGMEAVIAFEDGDPDRPICTGMVYDGTRKQPYDYGASENWTQIGLRSNSSPDAGGFNELMFDDKSGSERVYLQAQKDYEELVKNDATVQIDNNLTHTVKQDETREVTSGNLSVDVKAGTATLKAAQKIELVCGQSRITMTPSKIAIESTMIQVKGSAMAQMKAGFTEVVGNATLILKGGITKIN